MRYLELAKIYEKLESTTKRLEKTYYLSEFLKVTPAEELEMIILLLNGRVFPLWDERNIGVASKLVIRAISLGTGISTGEIEELFRKTGDLGDVAGNLAGRKRQTTLFRQELTVSKVFENLQKLETMEGTGSVDRKLSLIAELLTSAEPIEALYLIRTVLQELRVGVGAGSIRDAIIWAYFPDAVGFQKCGCGALMPSIEKCLKCGKELKVKQRKTEEGYTHVLDAVQQAYDLTNDFGLVARTARTSGLEGLRKIELRIGTPVKVMLALKAESMEDALKGVGIPAAVEYKYDGFRMQVHRSGDMIIIFTRRLENITAQFPEVVKYVRKSVSSESFILDGEAVGFDPKTKRYLAFQSISQRIKRKYGIEEMARDYPVELNLFDILYLNGRTLIHEEFKKRRKFLESIVTPSERRIVVARQEIVSDVVAARKFFNESEEAGNEGIMFKNISAPYKPGARVGHMVKFKEVMEGLDLVIVGAEYGEGKRSGWLTSYLVACQDSDGNLLEIGKVGTGVKEKSEAGVSYEQFTEMLKPLIRSTKAKFVKVRPSIVIEVYYEEIQKSPTYSSGYALRFPRFVRLRADRGIEDISTIKEVEELYKSQRHSRKMSKSE